MRHTLPILYQDSDIVAVHKPEGIKVHRSDRLGRQRPSALEMVRDCLGCRIHTVHRLDQPTSGVLLFALNANAAASLAAAFAMRKVAKTYVAVVRGHVATSGWIDYALTGDARRPRHAQKTKPAQTAYMCLANTTLPVAVGRYPTSRFSLLRINPKTGRMHQIRRHMHHISHPVIGDTAYGDGRYNRFFRNHFGCNRLLLAAAAIRLNHPRNGLPLHIVAPLPASFHAILENFGWLNAVPMTWHARATGPYLLPTSDVAGSKDLAIRFSR